MRSFTKIALVAIVSAAMASCETKQPTSEAPHMSFSDSTAKADSIKALIPRDTNETDVQDTMLEARPTEVDKQ